MKKTILGGIAATATTLGALLFGAAPAQAESFVFDICPSGHEGVVGGHTSCPFADNVSRAYWASGGNRNIIAYSPVTGQRYDMYCSGNYTASFSNGRTMLSTLCVSGNAAVVVW